MYKIKISKTSPFWIFTITHALFALGIFLNEVMSIYNRFPGGNYPIEHKSSWIKVILFCCVAIVSCFTLWFFDSKKRWDVVFPSIWLVVLFALVSISLGAFFSHYLAFMGWCCEHPLAFFFGFPFSFLLGIGGFLYPEMKPYENFDLLQIILSSEPQVHWKFLLYEFFLDFLFWANLAFILVSLFKFFKRKNSLFAITGLREVQSESS